MDGPLEGQGLKFGNHGQRQRVEALHVAGAAAEEFASLAAQSKRIGGPGLPGHRHHIRMARQHHAPVLHGPYGGEERGLVASCVGDLHIGNIQCAQMVLDGADEIEIRPGAFRIERDQLLEELNHRFEPLRGHGKPLSSGCA